MAKIYLCEDIQQTKLLRRLMSIDAFCSLMELGRRMPEINSKEKEAVKIILKYTAKNISEQLKKCEFFAKENSKEDDEESAVTKESMLLRATIGTCCILAGEEAEVTLNELQRLGKCKTLQEALKTGKNVILDD